MYSYKVGVPKPQEKVWSFRPNKAVVFVTKIF